MDSWQPERRQPGTVPAFLRYGLLAVGLFYVLSYLYVALTRMSYPHELEWMEGESVNAVRRVLDGKDLYVEPSIEFVSAIYPPLYFYVCAAVSKAIGTGFLPLRLVSFISSIGCLVLMFHFVRRETGNPLYGFLSAALFAAAFQPSGAWFDIGRVDSLFLVLLLAGVYLVRFGSSTTSLCIAALLVSLSFLTKQSALAIALPLGLYCILVKSGHKKVAFLCVFFLIAGAATLVLSWLSDGWYWFYVYELPKQHKIETAVFTHFWTKDLCRTMSIAFGVALLCPVLRLLQGRREDFIFSGLLLVSMLVISWASRLHAGGYANVLMPAYAAIAIYFGLGLHLILSYAVARGEASEAASEGADTSRRNVLAIFVYVLSVIQFVSCFYNPVDQIPTRSDLEAGRRLVEMIQMVEGDVFVGTYSSLPALAGKKTYAHTMSIRDVLRSKTSKEQRKLAADIRRALVTEPLFDAVILGPLGWRPILGRDTAKLEAVLKERYEYKGRVVKNESLFWPRVGIKTRPSKLYVLRRPRGKRQDGNAL